SDRSLQSPDVTQSTGTKWDNLGRIGAMDMWAQGFRGQHIVIANLDTGVDYTHPELAAQWRGGTNSWYDPADPIGTHLTPADLPSACPSSGHGTATMGIMVGKTVGVAPDAQWIAVKIFSDDYTTDPAHPCQALTSNILAGFQWILDPDGNPATPDAPQVVNSSWGASGCDNSQIFQPALQALRAAGILPVFSAGNYGPGAATGAYPGNYPEAFPVGATSSLDTVASFSSRGPNNCVTPPATYPTLSAPGVDIYTAGLGNTYVTLSGTSFAAPHVAGAIALLLSAFPQGLTIEQQETVLVNSAVDLGAPGPDNDFGYGRLDVNRAYRWLLPDAQVGFTIPVQGVPETAGYASLTVMRSGGISFPVSVDFSVAGGTAVAGVNYSPLPANQLDFAAGETQKTIQVVILNDHQPGEDKMLILTLSNARIPGLSGLHTASVNANSATTVLTILNTDPWLVGLPIVSR
ncbi:MAG: S8 family serine peptidase, partial [Anaerolineaceae bacterium]|nr:S8 family serine peptidase [Anaerolineaceae bacterium]